MVVHIKLLGKLRKPHLDADVVRFGSLSIYNSHGLAIAMAWVWLWPGCGLAFENWFMRRLCGLFRKLPHRLQEVVADFV